MQDNNDPQTIDRLTNLRLRLELCKARLDDLNPEWLVAEIEDYKNYAEARL